VLDRRELRWVIHSVALGRAVAYAMNGQSGRKSASTAHPGGLRFLITSFVVGAVTLLLFGGWAGTPLANLGAQGALSASSEHVPAAVVQPVRGGGTTVPSPAGNLPQTIPVGHAPELPVIDPTNGWVYVPNLDSNNVSILAGTSVVGAVALNASPVSAVVDSANGWVYVATVPTNSSAASYVDIVNGSSVAASVELGTGVNISGSVYSPANGCVYEVSFTTDTAFVVNGTAVVANPNVGSGAGTPVFDPMNGYVYVPNMGSSTVTYLNGTASNSSGPNGSVTVDSDPVDVVIDSANGFAYVIDQWTGWNTGSVSILNGSNLVKNVFLAVDSFGYEPTQGFWDPVHGVVYVLTQGDFRGYYSAVEVVQGLALAATDLAYPYGSEPLQATFDPAYGYLLVTNPTGGPNLTLVSNSSIVGNLSEPSGIQDGAFDSANGLLYLPLGEGNGSTNLTVLNGSSPLPMISSFTATPSPDRLGSMVVFDANTSGGLESFSYSYTGLPPGCLSANTSVLSCVPRTPGFFQVGVQVDAPSGLGSSRTLTLQVLPAQVNSFIAAPSSVEIGSPSTGSTNFTLNFSGGIGPFTYVYYGLPPGCASANVSPLPCVPDAASVSGGSPTRYSVFVNVTDAAGNYFNSNNSNANLNVFSPFSAAANVSDPTVDVGESDQFTASPIGGSGSATYAWLFGDGTSSPLPVAAHTYRTTGNYTAQLWANDSLGGAVHRTFPIRVDPALSVGLTVSNASPTIGESVQFNASASGGGGLYSYSYLGFPPGCVSVDSPTVGCLPTQAGTYNVSVNVTDTNSGSARASIAFTVVFGFTVIAPSSAVVGQPVTLVVQVATAAGTLHYGYTGLPPGCQSADSAQLTCTPTAAGQYSVGITVTSSLYGAAHKNVALSIVGNQGMTSGSDVLIEGIALGMVAVAGVALVVFLLLRRSGSRPPAPEPPKTPG
jgi:DNA-binding beta-propeller fold protein YncE